MIAYISSILSKEAPETRACSSRTDVEIYACFRFDASGNSVALRYPVMGGKSLTLAGDTASSAVKRRLCGRATLLDGGLKRGYVLLKFSNEGHLLSYSLAKSRLKIYANTPIKLAMNGEARYHCLAPFRRWTTLRWAASPLLCVTVD